MIQRTNIDQKASVWEHEGLRRLISEFENPPSEFTPMPFWFWNDTLTEAEITRQIRAFQAKGVEGFVIHPRLGLDPEIPYMGERWLSFVRYAVAMAKELNMKVMLYDEAMYPSGSCCGQVVGENPRFAAKGLKMTDSPTLTEEETLIAQAVHNEKTVFFILTPTRGTIRGPYFGQDDGEAGAPPAADLLNPSAVAAFIRLTHQKYYDALSDYFGDTVVAIFTDEPSLSGRCALSGMIPWTDDLLDDFKALGYDESHLPALFDPTATGAEGIRQDYSRMVYERMSHSYYGQIASWCEAHGILLAGHPESSADIHLLSRFGIPCQDIVWRYLYPGEPTNLRGVHSTMGKCASDSARHEGKRRNGNECFGVCGHRDDPYAFERADMKWYLDWLFARGCNLIIPPCLLLFPARRPSGRAASRSGDAQRFLERVQGDFGLHQALLCHQHRQCQRHRRGHALHRARAPRRGGTHPLREPSGVQLSGALPAGSGHDGPRFSPHRPSGLPRPSR